MAKETFSPGPWHTGADGRIVYDKDGWAICNAIVFHGQHKAGQDRANAAAIALLPELIDTLENMVAIVSHVAGSFAMRGEYGWEKADQADLDKAEALIVRARKAGK